MTRIETSDGRLFITIESVSDEYHGEELLIAAILHLIRGTASDFWEKDAFQAGDEEPPPLFYDRILSAIAHHAAVDDDRFEGKPAHEVLTQIIEGLRQAGYLQQPTVGVRPDEDDG